MSKINKTGAVLLHWMAEGTVLLHFTFLEITVCSNVIL